ncbi:substrate-binding domain-containing protein [Abyssalbus ytuae]|uniref:Substrate-binding domain-containing protein n=1 Tax=Abyssalbus ytuae TaxID=2926907 RepID=A0A9E6ZN75_9FLAO|nr:substrate-binding domain-containing protein [Abyssalbus ytuae]UOB17450.1 substrate-binding domain-containing protein [Abyssalbus ytuae]
MKTVTIAGVPEHFNLPWHLAVEDGYFERRGIHINWIDVPEGTGKMCKMLRFGESDIAVILTEGIIKDIIEGNPSRIVQTYVQSPLVWGIHVAGKSQYNSVSDLENKKAAISRFGSGSHLMAYVNAQNEGWNSSTLNFEIVNNLDGAIQALANGEADYFMWEHFTTKPVVDKGIFKRVGDCPTPWPCFVIAVRNEFLEKNESLVKHILEVINIYTSEFKMIPSIDKTLSNKYSQKLEDIREWLSMTQWSQKLIDEDTITKVQNKLKELKRIEKILNYTDLVKKL